MSIVSVHPPSPCNTIHHTHHTHHTHGLPQPSEGGQSARCPCRICPRVTPTSLTASLSLTGPRARASDMPKVACCATPHVGAAEPGICPNGPVMWAPTLPRVAVPMRWNGLSRVQWVGNTAHPIAIINPWPPLSIRPNALPLLSPPPSLSARDDGPCPLPLPFAPTTPRRAPATHGA